MWSNIVSSLAPYLSPLFAAAFGGFSGAYAAFFLERQRREKEEKKANISSARRAQLNIVGYINTLEILKRQYLDPLRNDPQREHKLLFCSVSPIHLNIDLDSLGFLADSKKPEVFLEINLAQRAHFSAIDALDIRNKWVEKFFVPETKNVGYDPETNVSEIVTDPRLVKVLKDHTDALYETHHNAMTKCAFSVNLLQSTIKELFPGEFSLTHGIKPQR
jgi:hypothetical protein